MLRQSDQTPNSETSETLVICPVCERGNPSGHKFCGMCGSSLPQVRVEAARISDDRASRVDERAVAPEDSRRESHAFEDSISNPHELSLFRSFRPSEPGDSDWDVASSPPYRLYLGLVIGLIVIILSFMGWRKSHQNAQTGPLPAPPIASTEAPAPAASNATSGGGTAAKTQPEARPEAEPAKAEAAPRKAATPGAAVPSRREPKTPPAASTQPQIDNGSQELATAQSYLSGSAGQQRDPSQAAQWLWKSIAKHNGQATVALADLFLRGDGVSKNCDQARVLLDSAARKGVTGARERLRNLQAFGCQ